MAVEKIVKNGSRHRIKQRPLSRKAKLIAGAVGIVLAWQITAISLASGHGDSGDDIKAADYAAVSQTAAAAAAGQRLTDGDPAGAKAFALRALSISPISVDSLRDLGLAEQGLGNWQGSGAIFSQAAALGWHDVPTQIWLAQAFLQQKNYEAAAERVDAALRIAPSRDLYQTLDALIADPAFARAMVKRLTLNPNWRMYYLIFVGNMGNPALVARARLLALMSGSASPPSRDELISFLYALVRADKTPLARVLWFRMQHISAEGIFDPGFAQIGTTGTAPFEWTLYPVPGVNFSMEPQGDHDTITATTDGTASGRILRQLIVLPPGPHSLSFIGSMSLAAHEAFGWSVSCRSGKAVLNTVRISSSPPYRFNVPQGCASQQVELLAASSAAAAGSKVSFQRVDID